jgi:ribosomal protein L13E
MATFIHPGSVPFRAKHLKKLEVGDCYLIEDHKVAYQAQDVVYRAARKLGIEVTTRRTEGFGRRIWRDA